MTNAWSQLLDRLFDSQRELVRLVSAEMGLGEEKLASTQVFLSQIANSRRPIPTRWLPHLKAVIERRGRERGVPESEIESLLRMVEIRETEGLGRLMYSQARADDTLILNASPLEITNAARAHKEAEQLQAMAVDALELGGRYHYCLGSRPSATRLWQALLRAAEKRFGTDAPAHVRRWADAGLLAVSVVPELLLIHPTVAFNTAQPDRLAVFVWHAPYDWEHCLALPDRQVTAWFGRVQSVLDSHAEAVPLAV